MTAAAAEPVIMIPAGISPPGRDYWVTPDMIPVDKKLQLPVPSFSVNTVATVFFGRSGSWLRLHMRLDGRAVFEPRRSRADARVFSLADIEPMAHALHQRDVIDTERLICSVMITKWVARIHGILED